MTSYNLPTLHRHTRPVQAGFTLVEIMVGLAIGMLASLVIIQVLSTFEAQKRTTTGTADAQTNGGIALYTIDRDLQMAGYPLAPATNAAPLNCTTGSAAGFLAPVTIVDGGGAAAGDTITVMYGTSGMGGVPSVVMGLAGNKVTLKSNLGCAKDDVAIIVKGQSCNMTTVTDVDLTTVDKMYLADPTGASDLTGATTIACLGKWAPVSYAVVNGVLMRNGAPSIDGIVSLQAQYGISDTVTSNTVTQWVNATGAWAAPTVSDRNRIKAVRIAVVARNAKKELKAVTTACSSTTVASPSGLCAWDGSAASPAPGIDLSGADADWLRYRYRVFETIVPLRNVIWARSVLQ